MKKSRYIIIFSSLTAAFCVALFLSQSKDTDNVVAVETDSNKSVVISESENIASQTKQEALVGTKSAHQEAMAKVDPMQFSEALKDVLGNNNKMSVHERLVALGELKEVSDFQKSEIYNFLKQADNTTGLSDEHFYWLKNDLMTYLRNHENKSEAYFDNLSSLYQDKKQSLVTRDYALQHLSVFAEQGNFLENTEVILLSALDETNSTLAGTALLSLSRLEENGQLKNTSDSILSQQAMSIAANDGYSTQSRVTALQVASKYRHSECSQTCEAILANNAEPALLKVSAIGALRGTENQSDKNLLENLKTNSDLRIQRAATLALANL